MRKLFITLALVSLTLTATAQYEVPVEQYSVATNSFWSNWFVQAGAQWSASYTSVEHGTSVTKSPFKAFRANPQAAVAIGKWFTPGLALRTKLSGIWGKSHDDSYKYWNFQEQALFDLTNMLLGYKEGRMYHCVPFAGGGFARNMSHNKYAMGLSVGLLNQFYLSKKLAINVEIGWNRFENDFYSHLHVVNDGETGWDSHDNLLYAEIGLTYNLGKATWQRTPDVDALRALAQSQIDALKAQLDDATAENARLKEMLANQPEPERIVETVKELVATPVNVFFLIDRTEIYNRRDLVDVQEMVRYALDNGCNLTVTGYADSATGKAGHNQWLSEQRCERVTGEIIGMGFPEERITKECLGGVDIISPFPYNRRVTVKITTD